MYRIVHNEQSAAYRVEKRGWLGWAFVSDPQTGDYLGFDSLEDARTWVRSRVQHGNGASRRWKIVSDCNV
jgi:hypothetical protein